MKLVRRLALLLVAVLLLSACGTEVPEITEEVENVGKTDQVQGPAYDKGSLSDDETATLLLTALQAGRLDCMLDLCAVEEFAATGYPTIEKLMIGFSDAPVIEYAPSQTAFSRGYDALRLRYLYSSDLMRALYPIVVQNAEEDLSQAQLDRTALVAQFAALQAVLEDFDFSGIQVESLVKTGDPESAVSAGWLDASFLDTAALLAELAAADMGSCRGSWSVYYAILSYGGNYYGLVLPLCAYEEGWRLQRPGRESWSMLQELGSDRAGALESLSAYSPLHYASSIYSIPPEIAAGGYTGDEEVLDHLLEALGAQDLEAMAALMGWRQVFAQLDYSQEASYTRDGLFSATSAEGWVLVSGTAVPTDAPGFSALSAAMFEGDNSSAAGHLYRTFHSLVAAQLTQEAPDQAQYIQDYCGALGGSVGALGGGQSEEELAAYRDGFPLWIGEEYDWAMDQFLNLLESPFALCSLGTSQIPAQGGTQCRDYVLIFSDGEEYLYLQFSLASYGEESVLSRFVSGGILSQSLQGMTDEEVMAWLRAEYGENVQRLPA